MGWVDIPDSDQGAWLQRAVDIHASILFYEHAQRNGKTRRDPYSWEQIGWNLLYPRPMKLEGWVGGVYWINLVRPSVRPSVDDMVSGA